MNQRNKERNSLALPVHCDPGVLKEFTSSQYADIATKTM